MSGTLCMAGTLYVGVGGGFKTFVPGKRACRVRCLWSLCLGLQPWRQLDLEELSSVARAGIGVSYVIVFRLFRCGFPKLINVLVRRVFSGVGMLGMTCLGQLATQCLP